MSLIQKVREFVGTCPFIDEFSGGVHVDYISGAEDYGVYPTGETPVSEDMCGNAQYQYNFVLQANRFTANDEMRLQSCEFVENFQRWVRGYSRTGIPLDDGCEFVSLEAGNGLFADVSEDGQTGTYQIMCNLIYERVV